MRIATLMKFGFLLSVVLVTDVAALETMTVYQTQAIKVAELHRVNRKQVDLIVVELDKVERLEAELTSQANLPPNASESGDNSGIRAKLKQTTLNALGRAWREVLIAQQRGVDLKRLPAVDFRGKVYHEIHDIRSILKP